MKAPARSAILLCFLAALAVSALALSAPLAGTAVAQSPFATPPAGQSGRVGAQAPSVAPPALMRMRIWVQTTQRDLHRQLAGAIEHLKAGEGLSAVWLLATLSFFYGVVHAIGPGHGKAVISSYVLANEKTVRRGIALGFLASLMQAVTAVAIVTVLAVLLDAAGLRIRDAARSLEMASYGLVVAVGAWLVWRALARMRNRPAPGVAYLSAMPAGAAGPRDHDHDDHHHHDHRHHGHDHGGDDCCGHAHLPDAGRIAGLTDWKGAAAIVLAVGLRPCTGALLVLVFSFANGLFLAGIGSAFAMSLGTAVTVSTLAVLAITSRALAMRMAGPGSRRAEFVFDVAALGGGLLVLALGMVLVAGSLAPARPF